MKILLLTALVALASADLSHLLNQQQRFGYQNHNPAPQNNPQFNYGLPQASVGNGGHSVSYSSFGSASVPQLTLPSISGSSVGFNSGFLPSPSGVSIQSYNGKPVLDPGSSTGFQVSTQAPSVDLSSFQASTPSPSIDLSNFQVSSPAPPSVDLSSFQVSSPSPGVDLSGFQASTPSSIPSVNLVQYSQPSSSYQFLSKLGQPSASVPNLGFSSVNGAQFGSDASFNAGVSIGSSGSFGSSSQIGSGFESGNSFIGETLGGTSDGNLGNSFGVVADVAGHVKVAAGAYQQSDVSKHLYFFDAPEEEEEEVHAKINLPAVPAKKTYKIIFIKAPTYRNQAAITIPASPQNEEKTLVYVLVKKPEEQPKVRFQDAAPTEPSKPEVFFIKYKTQKEAETAVAEIQSKHGAAGQVIAKLPAGEQVPSSLNLGNIGSVSQGGLEADVSLSSANIGGISVLSTTPSVIFDGSSFGSVGQSGFVSGASASSGSVSGFSVDSLGYNRFASSTPASSNFESRISEQVNLPAQVGAGEADLQYTLAQGGLAQSPTPVTFRQNSADSLQVIGSGIESSPSAPDASSSSTVGSSGVTFEADSSVGAQVQQQESNEGDSSLSFASSSEESSALNVYDASPSTEGSNVAQNVIEQRVDVSSGDNESQGSQAAGYATYGAPNY